MSPRNGVRTGTSPWTTDHTGALRRSCPRSSSGRAPPSEGGGCRFESGRGRFGPVAQQEERRSRKAEVRGATPLGSTAPRSDWTDTRVLSETVRVRIPPGPRQFSGDATSVFLARSPSRSPTVIGKTSRSAGFKSPASPPIRGRSSVGRAGPSPPPRLRSHADRRSMVIAAWVRIPAPPHFSSRGRSSVAEQLHTIATTCSLAQRTDG